MGDRDDVASEDLKRMNLRTQELQRILDLRHEPVAFSNIERAKSYAARCQKPMLVVLGDVDEDASIAVAWIVCPADAAKLEAAGYEIAL